MEGSKFIDRPSIWHEQKLEAQERIMALQFGQVDRRLWMTVYGVVAVILTQAVQSILQFAPKGG